MLQQDAMPEPASLTDGAQQALRAGRSCPASYGYSAPVFQRPPELLANTLYVVGGLYGNPYALDTIEHMAAMENHSGVQPRLVFNGDFHWFDTDPDVFGSISRRVLQHSALRGNVETELAGEDDSAGCGCAYPDHVPEAEVARSNQIIRLLRTAACRQPLLRQHLAGLPMHLVAQVGAARIGIVHGDATSLAGWDFAHDRLDDPNNGARLERLFRAAQVDIFASSHTCLPVLRCLAVDGRQRAVINNGAAGMPNFAGTCFGIISRIGATPAPDGLPVLHQTAWAVEGQTVHVAALAVKYDVAAWRARFLSDWPAGSPAHASYFQRIEKGPGYSMEQAYGTHG